MADVDPDVGWLRSDPSHLRPGLLLNIALVALFFSFLSLAQGSLWAAIGFHIGWNYAQGNLFGIPVSGTAREVALLALGPTAETPAWLTGSRHFAIEGSIDASIVLADMAVSYVPVPTGASR